MKQRLQRPQSRLCEEHAHRGVVAQVGVGEDELHEVLEAAHALLDERLALVADHALLGHCANGGSWSEVAGAATFTPHALSGTAMPW